MKTPDDSARDPRPGSLENVSEDLLFRSLEIIEDGGSAALDEFLAEHPEHAAEVREGLAALRCTGLLVDSEEVTEIPEQLGDFRISEKLGQGGMGVVYRAEQISLGREVALKLVRPEHLYFGNARARFRREVEAIASLHHPGIVAVYTVGEESGVPFFAMELVDGLSLGTILERLHGRALDSLEGADLDPTGEGASYLFAGTWEEACLRVARQVCDALQFAHGRGVLHRDIKPSNIMIAGAGTARAQLLDFGLARTEKSDKLTRTGSQMGSLPYMAPEQILEAVDDLGPATDVYSLGITLFEMMTLSPAFDGNQTEVALAVTQRGLPSLRSRSRRATWEVETIVAKATDPDPRRRYSSAADMARDLANALEKRPIEARRAGLGLRLQRWSQRHPAGSTAVVLGLLIAISAPTVYAWQQQRAARDVAAERDAAARAFRNAMDAVDRMLTRIGGDELAYLPGMEKLRQGLLEDAIDLLERVVQEGDLYVSREGTYELAGARQRLGQLFGLLGQTRRSVIEYEEGRQILTALLAEDPEDLRAGGLYISATTEEAAMRQESGELEAGLELHEELARWLAERSHLPEFAAAAARNRAESAHALALLGRTEEARAEFEASCPVLDKIAEDTAELEDILAAATSWSYFGDVWLQADKIRIDDAGVKVIERSLELFRQAVELDPAPQIMSMMCAGLNNTAGAYRRAERLEEADGLLEEALDVLTKLAEEHPNTLTFKLELAAALNQIAMRRMPSGWEAALPYFERSSRYVAEIASAAPEVAFFQQRLAVVQHNLAAALEATGAPRAKRERVLSAGVEASRRALELAPDAPEYRVDALELYTMWADLLRAEKDHARLVEVSESMLQTLPGDPEAMRRAAIHHAWGCAMIADGAEPDSEVADEVFAHYAARCCELVREAVQGGVDYPDLLEYAPLEPVIDTEQFDELYTWFLEWEDEREGQ